MFFLKFHQKTYLYTFQHEQFENAKNGHGKVPTDVLFHTGLHSIQSLPNSRTTSSPCWNGAADAFLLAHRKMFVPFASTRIGALKMASSSPAAAEQHTMAVEKLKNAVNIGAEFTLPTNLIGFLVVPKNSAIAEGGNFAKNVFPESVVTHDDDEQLDDDDLVNDDAKPVKPTLIDAFGSEEQKQNSDSAETFTEDEQFRMVKRMHHLSILRKIGSPGANIPASRLFGPLRQRELKRRAWMIQY
uniref:Uncharacterized protein n=1 Tax=Globodera rostochiensis TaxID=31243 RepID=A0A914I8W2_GLORO